jgi:putative membrane protein
MNQSLQLLPVDPWNRLVLVAFLLFWAASCINVPYPKYFWLQHVPTVAVIAGLAYFQNRVTISRLSFTLFMAFMAIHVVGARYLYSYVPYDAWSERLFGVGITYQFGFRRNHYDRLVHFCFGLLLVVPAWRFSRRIVGLGAKWSVAFAMMAIVSAGAIYEICEWLAAMIMAPDWAESYNGQQGDIWDAQWDMALASCGALIGLTFIAREWIRPTIHDKVRMNET